ncbi:hypothetical protein JCM10213_005210 [Rhodosporidiobolus nylandii]
MPQEVSLPLARAALGGSDAWCSSKPDGDLWDGVDFEHCFRVKLFDGILPLSFLSLSLFFFSLHALRLAYSLFFTSKDGHIRLPTDEQEGSGSTPIAQAEKAVLRTVAGKQSPDWLNPATQRELLGAEEGAADGEKGKLSAKVVARAAWGCKKDVLNLAVSAGIVAVLVLKTVRAFKAKEDGRAWVVVELVAWAWATVLVLFKLALSFCHRLVAVQHPTLPHRNLSSWYTTLERHLIPFICLFASLTAFFDARTALLDYHSFPYGPAKAGLKVEAALFALSFVFFLVEAFAPRPSRFSARKSRGGDREAASTYIDAKGKPLPPPPELNASLFSQATWSYMEGFQLRAAFPSAYGVRSLKMDSVPDLRPDDKTARVLLAYRQSLRELDSLLQRLPAFLRRRLTRGKENGTVDDLSLAYKLSFHFFPALVAQNVYGLVRVAMSGVPPLMLKAILAHIGKRNRGEPAPTHVALLCAWFLFLGTVVGSLGSNQGLFIGRRICIRLRSIIVGEVFTKALRRKDQAGSSTTQEPDPEGEAAFQRATTGKILNLISSDTYRLSSICSSLHQLTTEMPLTVVFIMCLLYRLIGISVVPGVLVFIVVFANHARLSKFYHENQLSLVAAVDERLAMSAEVLSQIRIVKYFAWGSRFAQKMNEIRKRELDAIWQCAKAAIFGGNFTFSLHILVAIVTFSFHTKVMKRELTAQVAFPALALFDVLRPPLENFVHVAVNVLQALVSLGRIDEYLREEETHKYSILQESASVEDPKVGFVNGTFTWAGEEEARNDVGVFRIENLNLSFPEGKLSIVLGPVGSGKTTILLSLLGETNRLSGSAFLPSPVIRSSSADPTILTETTAYAAQLPWLLSATIRENILFGSLFNAKRYQATLEACALVQDLKQFELGDETEVGEKGTVLSGGQKARIALARAIYSPAKYVLLDVVLSAVDSHTAQHLVECCLSGKLMKHRTCVLVTHAVDLCLPYASYVVTLENGKVASAGPPAALSTPLLVELETKQAQHSLGHEVEGTSTPAAAPVSVDEAQLETESNEELKLIKDETHSEGSVKMSVFLGYLKALGGLRAGILGLLLLASAEASDLGNSSFDLFRLDKDRTHDLDFWLRVFVLLAAANLVLISLRAGFWFSCGLSASKKMYTALTQSILGAPIRWFDTTPVGRIVNRLSRDLQTVDQDLVFLTMFAALVVLQVVGSVLAITAVLPTFLPVAVALLTVYSLLGRIYLASSRELKRFESVTHSPIFSLFGEVLHGVSTVRAYGDSARFIESVFQLLDNNNRPFFTMWLASSWLNIRIDAMGALAASLAAFFVILAPSMDAGLAGFALSLALAFNERIIQVVQLTADLEVAANSIERVQEYSALPQESETGIAPPAIWPSRGGNISVNQLTASYGPGLPSVLKSVSFEIKGREKIGIVGRTGSGKSTLGLSFFRFIEPSSGNITIDGIDINTLRLDELRSRLTIVAQEAGIFAGTLRFNLDPFDQHSDADVWNALQRVQMAAPGATGVTPRPTPGPSRAASVASGSDDSTAAEEETERYVVKSLDMVVTEGGKNFSAGQRQLLALARGILKLKTSSILILDESTASLDHATDERIQRTIREEMADATILCIAHRLRTIIDYTKILVLDHGVVQEFDTPLNLLAKEDSAFSALCRKTGEYDLLKEMVEKAAGGKK